ncbi:hypothetical protein [Rhizobium wuzhouense]|nr:hypothetical protein [Rhizobium wuzhouense]
MTSRLEFGPQMLALFLQAHVVYAGVSGASLPVSQRKLDGPRKAAEHEEERRLAKAAGLSVETLRQAARCSHKVTLDERTALWLSMEINPYIHQRSAA